MTLIFSTRTSQNEEQENKRNPIKVFSTAKSPDAVGPYSKAVLAGEFLFCSGQIGLDSETGELVKGGIEEEAKQSCRNISAVLSENSFSLKDVVKTTIYLKYIGDFQKINDIYKNYFVLKPARSLVEVANLPKNALIEIEVIARKGNK